MKEAILQRRAVLKAEADKAKDQISTWQRIYDTHAGAVQECDYMLAQFAAAEANPMQNLRIVRGESGDAMARGDMGAKDLVAQEA